MGEEKAGTSLVLPVDQERYDAPTLSYHGAVEFIWTTRSVAMCAGNGT